MFLREMVNGSRRDRHWTQDVRAMHCTCMVMSYRPATCPEVWHAVRHGRFRIGIKSPENEQIREKMPKGGATEIRFGMTRTALISAKPTVLCPSSYRSRPGHAAASLCPTWTTSHPILIH